LNHGLPPPHTNTNLRPMTAGQPRHAAQRAKTSRHPMPPIQRVPRRGEAAPAASSPPVAHADSSRAFPPCNCHTQSIGVKVDIQYPGANLRSICPRFGWECGEGERTVLRKLDRAEDDGGVLRVDFTRLRGVSAQLSKLTCDSKKKVGEAPLHDNLCFALIMTRPITGTGPPSDGWVNCPQSKPVHREPSL
jgi:hypothetical protein